MAEYEARLEAYEMQGGVAEKNCFPCSTAPGLVAEADLLLLKPFQSEGESPGFDYQPAYRFGLGWTCANGLGVRVRWFEYENHNAENVFPPPLIEDLNLTVVDFELTDKFSLAHWQGMLSGGLRYADYEEFGFFDAEHMDDSLGVVLGVELTRPVVGGWAIFGAARYSYQYAESGLDNGSLVEDMTFSIGETQLGVQWTRCRAAGGEWFVEGAVEAQYWSGGTIGDGDTEDLGLIGGILSVGITR